MKSKLLSRRKAIGWAVASVYSPAIAFGTIGAMPFAAAAVSVPPEFRSKLKRGKLTLDTSKLQDFNSVRVLPNPHFEYDLGVRHSLSKFEIRYAIRDIGPFEKEHEQQRRAARGNPNSVFVPFEQMIVALPETSIMNMSHQKSSGPAMGTLKPFKPDAVKAEFGADWGFTCWFRPRSTFANHPSGQAVVIYRHDVRTHAYMMHLYEGEKNDGRMTEAQFELYGRIFYALRFEAQ